MVNDLAARGVGLKVLSGQGAIVNTTVPSGKLAFDIFAALASSRHELRVERGKGGDGYRPCPWGQGGRLYKMAVAQLRMAMAAMAERETNVSDLCRELGITRQTLYRHVGPDG